MLRTELSPLTCESLSVLAELRMLRMSKPVPAEWLLLIPVAERLRGFIAAASL
jgi:hypothetical protein